jgi:hypothetical protein
LENYTLLEVQYTGIIIMCFDKYEAGASKPHANGSDGRISSSSSSSPLDLCSCFVARKLRMYSSKQQV